MKIFRIGNNIDILWTIKKEDEGVISLNSSISLLDKNNNAQVFEYVLDGNEVRGTFYGKDQTTLGAYRLCLIENKGKYNQTIVDYLNAFTLAANLKNSTAVNQDEVIEDGEVYTLGVESFIGINSAETDFAKKSDIPTKVSQLENDSNFISSVDIDDKLSKKADKSEIPTKVSELENDEHYLTEHQDLYEYAKTEEVTEKIETAKDEIYSTVEEEYAKKAEIPSKVSELENDKGYLTEHQSLEEYAKKSEIPNVPTKVSELENDKGYLTEHQSLKDYATLEYVQTIDNFKYDGINYNKATKRIDLYVGDKIRGGVDVTDFVKDGMLDNVKLVDNNLVFSFNKDAEKEDIVITLPKDFIPSDYYTKTDVDDKLSVKADKSEIPTVPTKVSELENDVPYLTEHQSLEGYALKTELPTKTSQLTNDSGYITSASIPSDYAKKTDIPTKVSQLANDSGYLTEHQDISGKVDVTTFNEYKQSAGSEIENKQEVLVSGTNIKTINGQSILGSGNITIEGGSTLTIDTEMSDTSTNAVQNKVIKSYVDSQTVNIPTKTSQLVNDSGYITSASISTDYAKKTDLPTKTSQLTNDSGYITSASLSTDFAKVTYVDTQDSTTLKTANSYTDTSITNLTWKGTQAQYDALTTIDDKVIYFIKES